ncbi:Purple acid phosphatase [Arachis hypogaea]|nr:Purple acid phosphatase [Arachis hypogaea]
MGFLAVCMFLAVASYSSAKLHRFQHAPKPDGSLTLFVIGDWGRRGTYNQSQLAFQMGIVGKELDIDFVISTGDNIYPSGLKGTDDAAFDYSCTQIYTAPSLQKLWYTLHVDKRWICFRSYVVDARVAEFFFLDTTPFVDKYFTQPPQHVYDWRGVLPRNRYISNLLTDLHFALKQSNVNWKIVVGHHTIRSAGFHGNTLELQNLLLPILQENNVDLYINGHDHCLQHISSLESPIQFLTSGGGSKAWRGVVNWWKPEEMKF